MYGRYKILSRIVLFLSLSVMISSLSFAAVESFKEDSLQTAISGLSGVKRLESLEAYIREHTSDPLYRDYIRFYESEALKQNDASHQMKALDMLARSFYPESPDSMLVVKNKMEQLARKNNDYDRLIDLLGVYNNAIVWNGQSEGVEESIKEYRKLSLEQRNEKGVEMADQNMAYFYFMNNMPDDAEKLFLEVLERKVKRNAPFSERVAVLVQLFNNVAQKEKKEKYLQAAIDCIAQYRKSNNRDEKTDLLMVMQEYSAHWTYSALALEDGKLDVALEHMKVMGELLKTYNMKEDRRIALDQLYFEYYYQQKNWDKALEYLSRIEAPQRQRNVYVNIIAYLEKRAEIYFEQGRFTDVIDLQKEIIHLKDSVGQSDLQERIADMRTKYEVEKLQIEKQQIEITNLKTRSRMMLLAVGCLVLFLAIIGLIYIVRITQRSKRSFKLAKEKAEEADQMKTAFLANMNHEIRTPLNAIVGFSQVLVEEEDRDNRKEFADIIESNNELLQRLIADVLDISKIESNSMSLIYKEHDMETMMKEIYSVISLRVPETIRLILDPVEPVIFETDRNRLMQVLTNLLTNAIKHTSAGHIRYGYTLTETEIRFFVEDTGEGIPKENLESIFDRFTQLENGKKGVGLGLAISKGLITKMGGKIWATSVLHTGSVFHVVLPRVKPPVIS